MLEKVERIQYAPPGPGPWKLYVYDRDGYARGARWFRNRKGLHPSEYPDDEISREAAKDEVVRALIQGLEVRITDDGDRLVFHARGIKQIYPPDGNTFWAKVGL